MDCRSSEQSEGDKTVGVDPTVITARTTHEQKSGELTDDL